MLQKLEYELTESDIKYKRFGIGKKNSGFFLPPLLSSNKPFPFDLETTDIGLIKTTIRQSTYRIGKSLRPWFGFHTELEEELKKGTKILLLFEAIEPTEKYRLEIIKERES